MRGDDDEEEESSVNATRYPCMPSLVALQQMRNRLHLAHLGKKLMKWTAMATGRELRRLAGEIDETYKNFAEDMRSAFMLLARGRYFYPNMNNTVLENVALAACVTVATSSKSISGVKVLQLEVIETGFKPYPHLGIEKGGQTIQGAKKAWLDLLKRLIIMLQQRTSFYQLEQAHKSATKKKNVLSKIVIPRLSASIRYILSELEEKEREEIFRLKRVKQNKIKALEEMEEVGAGEKTQVIDKVSEVKIKSEGKPAKGPVAAAPPAAEGGDPLVVIKPPVAGETGDAYKSTQQFQTVKTEKEKEGLLDVEKVDLQGIIEDTGMLKEKMGILAVPETKPEVLTGIPEASLDETKALREGVTEDKTSKETTSSSELLSHSDTGTDTTESKSSARKSTDVILTDRIQETQEKVIEAEKLTKPAADEKNEKFSSETPRAPNVSETSEEEETSTTSNEAAIPAKSDPSIDKITLSADLPNDTSLETSTLTELSSNREIGETKSALKAKPPISGVNIIDAEKNVTEKSASSEISDPIALPEATKLFEDAISPETISFENLKQDKTNVPPVDDTALLSERPSMSPPEVSKTETTKSKSSVRIKLPSTSSDETVQEPQNKELKTSEAETAPSEYLPSKTSTEAKQPVEVQEKMTEGSVEKLGEGDNQMYTGQGQTDMDKTRIENEVSVEGIVDAEPYFEVATASKERLENVDLPERLKEAILQDIEPTISRATTSDDTKYYYEEADIDLDETDIDISTSRPPSSSKERDKTKEVEEADPEEQGDDPNNDKKDKPSKSSEDKKH
ncbi:hypothetical protein O3G_MSEX003803 [Manduca sexta]|uniref:Uncharacterized protein n=1 Tax=Manduca sexta TaxID=7130 RepID=A0A922CGD3_MANSE|nr:hypothetical protein O3G_MSEX003803 [Manduca sexta]